MTNEAQQVSPAAGASLPIRFKRGDWTIDEYDVVTSTNLVAARLPAWHAVRARTQTHGRGRFHRTWISDEGGLWLSAVMPLGRDEFERCVLPLEAGLATCNVLRNLGASDFRMRWPNDVLVRDRKVAGLLIDQFVPGLAVVGIGINVSNDPEAKDSQLKHLTTRLADVLPAVPALDILTDLLLQQLISVRREREVAGAREFFERINQLWALPRKLELDLDGKIVRGTFKGVDLQGRLLLSDAGGQNTLYHAHEVRHLSEI